MDYGNLNCKEQELARVYIKMQVINEVFNSKDALKKGTLFPELYKPYNENKNNLKGGRYNG